MAVTIRRKPLKELMFEDLVRGYCEDYELHAYRAIKSALSRVARLRLQFAGQPAGALGAGGMGEVYDAEDDRASSG